MRNERVDERLDFERELDIGSLGKGVELESAKMVQFTHAKAQELMNCEVFEAERPFRNLHYQYLVKQMREGAFRPELVSIGVCELKGKLYRMNGQHTARARLQQPAEYDCKVRWLHYKAKTQKDMRMIYATFDRGAPRTRQNVISSYIVGSDEFKGIRKDTLKRLPQGYSFWKWPERTSRRSNTADDVSFLLLKDDRELALKVAKFLQTITKGENPHVFRAPVIAAMFATFEKAPRIAEKFWRGVATGMGFEHAQEPGLRLRNYLQNHVLSTSGADRATASHITGEKMFRACLFAWNKYRAGELLVKLRPSDIGERPVVK